MEVREKCRFLKGIILEGKRLLQRHFREAQTNIYPRLGFAPASNPQVIGLCVINNPQGLYYGGIIAAPVIQDIYKNILPYLGVENDAPESTEEETEANNG